MLLTDNLATFAAMLDKDPGNVEVRLMCADVLEEIGEEDLANTYRWMVENKKYPPIELNTITHPKLKARWFNDLITDYSSSLPMKIYQHLQSQPDDYPKYEREFSSWYNSRLAAEQALCHALKSLNII